MNLQKRKPIRSKRILNAASGQQCTMMSPMCTCDTATVAFRHSNYGEDGKGRGIKSEDIYGFFGCQACEDWYSMPTNTEDKRIARDYFHQALKRTWKILFDMGVLIVK